MFCGFLHMNSDTKAVAIFKHVGHTHSSSNSNDHKDREYTESQHTHSNGKLYPACPFRGAGSLRRFSASGGYRGGICLKT